MTAPAREVRPDELPFEDAPPEIVGAMGGRLPTIQQWEAISHSLTPCAVIAGAGSGKTAVMAARVVYLALVALGRLEADHAGTLPSQILCLTFTNKAAEELFRRVRDATAGLGLPEGEEATVLTYHAFAARLLEDFGLHLGLEPGLQLLSDAQRWQIGRTLLEDVEFEHVEVRTDYVVGQALALADQCSNHLREPSEVAEHARALAARAEVRKAKGDDRRLLETALRRVELATLAQAFQDRKRELGAIDYGDQIALASRLVGEHPEVADEFRARFPVVLLDEYQDTNVAQARLLQRLCGPGYPIFAVGDPDQNIYAWRGASLSNLLRFIDDFGEGDRRWERPLYVNFRSGSRVLAVADAVIADVPPERRAKDKELRPHPSRGEGRVTSFVAPDARDEARQIARMIKLELQGRPRTESGDPAWGDVAILCRKSRLFDPVIEVLREEEIPLEVVDLGGLLKLPEVVEVTAWLRLLNDPGHNVSLARILQGPRWRIGYRDLVALARWSMGHTRRLGKELPEVPGDVAFALVEALDHVDDEDMVGLSEGAADRLKEFRELLGRLRRTAVGGSLGDLLSSIMEESGLLPELEASASPAAAGARRNLLNLVQHVSAFSPVEGDATLATLVTYLDAAEDTEEDLERAQPSEANTVKMLTIHKAKGLEWPIVFVPGLAEHDVPVACIFPDTSRQANPVLQPQTLPFELRGDADVLPAYQGRIAAFRQALRDRGMEEERRLCYVAFTRARDLLVASAAYWYEGPREPYRPGVFYEQVAAHPAAEELFRTEQPEESPLIEIREQRAAGWPSPGHPDDRDELFPEGWHGFAVAAARDPREAERRAERLEPASLAEFRRLVEADRERLALIRRRTATEALPSSPSTLSISGLIDYFRCPKLFFWSQIRPLPRRPSPAARLGSEVHRWIELESRGQGTLIDLDDIPDLSTDERLGPVGHEARLKEAFRASRFAGQVPLYTERPFLLYVDGVVVGGRIDAIFGQPEGDWEVVDYKTGRVPPEDDPLAGLQLDLYALACAEIWGKRPEELTLTYFYLAESKEVTRGASDFDETRRRVAEALTAIAAGRFEPSPSERCRWCDFLSFCEAGRKYVREAGEGQG